MDVVARQAVLGADAVRAWAATALTACRAARERIDAVNVFPVPDADTGSNVTLTVAGGAAAVASDATQDPTALVATFARGAARAARGNSGIILSQWLVGFAAGLRRPAHESLGVESLVGALERAAHAARSAVPDPQEGTVLTVAGEVALHARRCADVVASGSPGDVVAAAADAARADLARLSAGHDVLRAAHVVDAGACALLVVLDALSLALRADRPRVTGCEVDLGWLPQVGPEVVAGCAPAGGGAFEVMMLVRPGWAGADGLAEALQGVGDAVAVVETAGVRHAHVHCDDPGAAIGLVPARAREQVVVRRVDEPAPAARGLVVLTASPDLAGWYATCGAVTLVGTAVDAGQVARAAVDTRAERVVVVDAGVGPPGAGPDGPHDLVPAAGDGAAVVACLALVADPQVTPAAARAALHRLRSTTPAGPDAVPDAVAALLQDVPGAQGVTILHGSDVAAATARAAGETVLAAFPELEVVVAGPAGSAWWVGVD